MSRGLIPTLLIAFSAIIFFSLGNLFAARQTAATDNEQIAELRAEVGALRRQRRAACRAPAGTRHRLPAVAMDDHSRAALVADIKQQLKTEMGLMPVSLLRERRQSFVEMYSYDGTGASNYGTAGYLGHGYFITVKHGVIALGEAAESRKITSVKIMFNGRALAARIVDAGDAQVEVDPGDWAILKVKEAVDLPRAQRQPGLWLRVRRPDLPARQRLLEGHHPLDRQRRPAHAEQPRHLPHRRPSRRVGRRRAEWRRPAGRHPDRPDAGGLPVLVHPAAARRDVPEGLVPELSPGRI